jgi:hypothetical protein
MRTAFDVVVSAIIIINVIFCIAVMWQLAGGP